MKTPPMAHDLVCWGSTEFGQDGQNFTGVDVVSFNDGFIGGGVLKGRTKLVACGSSHTVVVTDSDEIYAWGNGSSGQIASPDMFTHRTPVKVTLDPPIRDDVTISQVTCGMRHSMVVLSNGQVYAFGNNFFAQLGYDFQTENYKENQVKPLLLKNVLLNPVLQVACGDKHSLFLFADGSMAAVGNNSHGQIGDGTRKESVVPKHVDLECNIKVISSGSNHNLAISGAGDVYVWGFGKGCGHRRHDVLGPELKLLGHDVVQVAGGGFHSMALTNTGDVFVWGFGTDGQLGLGERVVTSAVPKRLRHRSILGNVSQIACGELYSAAVTRDGLLYMWGRNSHCIDASMATKEPYFKPVCISHPYHHHDVPQPNDGEHSSIHSVYCGTWHVAALLGTPDWIPHNDDTSEDDDSSDNDDDDNDDDGMTSEGSESTRSSIDDKNLKPNEDIGGGRFGLDGNGMEPTSTAPRYTGINKATSPPHPVDSNNNHSPSMFPSRAQTKLTLGEFYALTDSSPSDSKNTTPKSSPRPSTNASGTPASSPTRKEHHLQQQQHNHQKHQQQQQQTNNGTLPSLVVDSPKPNNVENKENQDTAKSEQNRIITCPAVHVSSPSSSPDFSVISESSLKKRMAENIEQNKGIQFKARDWSGHRRGHRMSPLSPLKPMEMTPSPEHELSPRGRLSPRASCRSKAASLTERAHTMFISKSTADHFILPREQTFISKQSMSLMDLGNLRSGAVFENYENHLNHDESTSSSRNTSAGHFHSNASSRLSMASPYTENDLREIISHKSPDKRKLEAIPTLVSSSDTPSNMMRYNRMKDMSCTDPSLDSPLKPTHVLFATPSPNFGSSQMGNGDLRNNTELHRPRALYGIPQHKHYRKPGLPGVDMKTKIMRPGHLHGPSLHSVDGSIVHINKKDKLLELPTHRNPNLSSLEITAPSIKNGTSNTLTPPKSTTADLHGQHNNDETTGSDSNRSGYAPSQAFINLTPRRAQPHHPPHTHPTGTLWRSRTQTQNMNPKSKPADLAIDIGATLPSDSTADAPALRKDYTFTRSFHSKNSGANNVIKMKKNVFFEKAQTSLAISGAGAPGPKGQYYLRQVNTSASSRNHRKT